MSTCKVPRTTSNEQDTKPAIALWMLRHRGHRSFTYLIAHDSVQNITLINTGVYLAISLRPEDGIIAERQYAAASASYQKPSATSPKPV